MTKTKIPQLVPRNYQLDMMEAALDSNIIACLGTGTGKTFIGVLVVKSLAHQVRPPFEEGGKRTFFLVPTVPLVHQQAEVLKTLTDLEVGSFVGDMKVDTWSEKEWNEQFLKYNVLVMTAEIFRVILHHGFLPLSRVNLIIFDECHRAVKNHPYREIMRSFDTCSEKPKVLGLTASILNGKCKAGQLEKKIKGLEQTLRSRAIIPEEMSEIDRHGTKPKEVLLHFSSSQSFLEDGEVSTISTLLSVTLADLPDGKSSPKRSSAACDNSDSEEDDFNPVKDARKYVTDVKDILETLGVWCTRAVLLAFLRDIALFFERGQVQDEMKDALSKVRSVFQACLHIADKLLDGPKCQDHLIGRLLPSKLMRLLQALNSKNPDLLQGDSELCGVIFVQKRLVAYILNKWLVEASKHPPYTFIKCHFMVGHGSNLGPTELQEISMESKHQRKVLEDFRHGKYNLLIASSVIEEGMDVPKCNLIIRFDPPIDYRAYVQSKGRARARNSIYLLMTPDNEDRIRLLEDLTTYNAIEKILKNYCQDREMPTEEEIDFHMQDQLKEPYMPFPCDGGARVTMTSSIQLLNRYCSKLGSGTYGNCAPRWKIRKIEDEFTGAVQYQCTIWMPMISPIRDPIVGDEMRTKQAAKMAVALDACKILHKHGELDDKLLPINLKDMLKEDEENNSEEYRKELRLGASNKQAYYPKKFLAFEPVTANTKCYFYVVHIKLMQNVERNEAETVSFFNPYDSSYRFALVVSQQVKHLISFHMFTESGKVRVWLEEKGPYRLTDEELKLVHCFHQYTFTDMVRSTPFPLLFVPETNTEWLLAPVQFERTGNLEKTSLCVDLMKKIQQYSISKSQNSSQNVQAGTLVLNNKDCHDALIRPLLESDSDMYYVVNVCEEITAKSPFPKDAYETFEQYYKEKLKYVIQNPQNPLVEAKHVSKPLFNIPGYFNQNGNFVEQSVSRLARRVHFPVEVLTLLPYPASLHRQSMYLPCILSRFNSLIFVQELQERIVEEAKVGAHNVSWPSLDFPRFFDLNQETRKEMERVLKKKEKEYSALYSIFEEPPETELKTGPSPCMLLEALTTKHYCDMFDLERLETVGDSFLKYAVSLHLFCKHPRDNEGKLTVRKVKQISNANLLKLGIRKKVTSLMCNKKMSPLENWLPPGYKLPPELEETQAELAVKAAQRWLETEMPDIWEITTEERCSRLRDLHDHLLKQMPENENSTVPKKLNMSLDLRTLSGIGNKSVADCVEGLIGAYVVTTGVMGGLRFLDWLGVEVFPEDRKPENLETSFAVPMQFTRESSETESLKAQYFSGLENLENSINYHFKNKMYLLEALWHPSCDRKPITDCYQRLEFLGDAVLDYIITRYLYEDPKQYNPGELTDIRMSLVNNEYFAKLAVKNKFHQHMKYFAPELIGGIVSFVKMVDSDDLLFFQEISVKEKSDGAAEELEVPKVLGDVVESVAGAIYLDSGLNLKTVWKVFYDMMKKDIEARREAVPKNPIRTLYELFPGKVKFQKLEEMPNKKVKIAVDVDEGKYRFLGFAANKKTAKLTAAKIALYKLLRKKGE